MDNVISARQMRIEELAYQLWQAAGEPTDAGADFWHQAKQQIETEEAAYDKTIDASFPASDPPASSGIT